MRGVPRLAAGGLDEQSPSGYRPSARSGPRMPRGARSSGAEWVWGPGCGGLCVAGADSFRTGGTPRARHEQHGSGKTVAGAGSTAFEVPSSSQHCWPPPCVGWPRGGCSSLLASAAGWVSARANEIRRCDVGSHWRRTCTRGAWPLGSRRWRTLSVWSCWGGWLGKRRVVPSSGRPCRREHSQVSVSSLRVALFRPQPIEELSKG
mmetsp:Transcript_84951/g.193736  ORF Transcript_84951/g.193736 Transcript_84951/m.193736 type:complete len:205 (+) Transcript_84951:199-813(+)